MSCFHPIPAWRYKLNPDSRFNFTLAPKIADTDIGSALVEQIKFPCGLCIGCRIDRAKEWAVRCVLEAQLHEENSFVTLTYDDAHLPANGSLDFRDLTLFMKRLRKKYSDRRIRYYAVGEYGAELQRPHFHVILFGFDFADKRLWSYKRREKLFRSSDLESLWTYGYSTVGTVSVKSCAYVARYIQKKFFGSDLEKKEFYGSLIPESARMSRRPGIAADWFKQYSSDVYPKDFIVVNGHKYKPSRFFDNLLKNSNPDEYESIKLKRFERMMEDVENNTPDRLETREKVLETRVRKLRRGYEAGEE